MILMFTLEISSTSRKDRFEMYPVCQVENEAFRIEIHVSQPGLIALAPLLLRTIVLYLPSIYRDTLE